MCQTISILPSSLAATLGGHQLSSRGIASQTLLSHRLPLRVLWLVSWSVGDVFLVEPVMVHDDGVVLRLHFLYRILKLFF